MSMPVKYCLLVQAADDPRVFKKIHPVMKKNIEGGHFTVVGCDHDPPCRDLTEWGELLERFRQPVEGNK